MLPYKNRLIFKGDFEKVYRFGSFFSFGSIFLKINKNEVDRPRIGFSIGIKFSKKAVERNRAKRQLRAIIFKNLKNIKKGVDIVVMIKKIEKTDLTNKQMENDLLNALKKSNLIVK